MSKRGSRQIRQLVRTRMGVSSKAGRDHGLVLVSMLGNHKLGLSRSVMFSLIRVLGELRVELGALEESSPA